MKPATLFPQCSFDGSPEENSQAWQKPLRLHSVGSIDTAMEAAAAARDEHGGAGDSTGAAGSPTTSGGGGGSGDKQTAEGGSGAPAAERQQEVAAAAQEPRATQGAEGQQRGIEAEVAAMLSGMTGDVATAGAAAAAAAVGTAPAAAPAPLPPGRSSGLQPASVASHEGLPVLPDCVRNKDAKRDLPLICHIVGCGMDLTTQADYYQRYRICKDHLKSPAMLVDGIPQRFCQQCGRFHELHEFDSDKRNCRARLQQHNSRRRKVFAMSQELKRNKYVKADNCLVDPNNEVEAAMAAAMAASGVWPAGLPLPGSGAGMPQFSEGFGSLPGLPGLPMVGGSSGDHLDPSALAAAMAAASAGLDNMDGGRTTGVKRSYSGMEGGGSEVSAGVQRMLQETARGLQGWRPGPGDRDGAAEGLLSERYQHLLGAGGGRSKDDPSRFFGPSAAREGLRGSASQLSNPFLRGRGSPAPAEGSRGTGGGWPGGPQPAGSGGGQPSSTLLEQMARRVLLNSSQHSQGATPRGSQQMGGGGGGPWGPSSDVREHPEAQALSAVYPELAAQIQLLSHQLQAVQAQLASVMPGASEDSLAGLSTGPMSAGTAPSGPGWGEPSMGGGLSTGRPTARQPPPMFSQQPAPSSSWQAPTARATLVPASSGGGAGGGGGSGGFTAEDLLKAFAAGMQQNGGGPGGGSETSPGGMPSRGGGGGGGGGGGSGLQEMLAKATGLGLPPSFGMKELGLPPPERAAPLPSRAALLPSSLPPAPGSPGHDLPPNAWSMLQALLQQPPGGSGSPAQPSNSAAAGGGGGGGSRGAAPHSGPPASAIEQLSAALRAASGPQGGPSGGRPMQQPSSSLGDHPMGPGPSRGGGRSGGGGGGDGGLPMSDMFAFLASMGHGPHGGGGSRGGGL